MTRHFEMETEAVDASLAAVTAFVKGHLEESGCSLRNQMQIELAVEEIFVNIAHYAYAPGTGRAVIRMEVTDAPALATIIFIDQGTPYDPLAKPDPDVGLSAMEREIGGLGIYLTKKTMDDVRYEYKDGKNILTLMKKL